MVPEYPAIEPLNQSHLELLTRHLALEPRMTCDLALANLYIWSDCESPSLTFIHGNLCILIDSHSEPPYFLEPLGREKLSETIDQCLKHTGRISRVQEGLLGLLPDGAFHASPLRDHFDYVYEVRSLAELKGKKFDGKRNQIRKFIRNFPNHCFVALQKKHSGQALELFDRWSAGRDAENSRETSEPPDNIVCQRQALITAFADFDALNLMGGAIFVDDRMEGMMIASASGSSQATAHLQYANYNMAGIYQLLLMETCRQILQGFEFVNLEEDLGIAGLRRTKLSNQPLRLEKKYLLTPA
jgi:uncharacterized protein